jgi:Leucine-rich repeat (LRR) protein
MSNNTLKGGLPASMETMPLQYLDLSSNQLTGTIPPLPQSLYMLDISKNFLAGPLPSNFGAPMLTFLYLSYNRISNQISKTICEFKELLWLNLANNFLVGEIPMCLGATKLISLELSNNSQSGELSSSLQNLTNMIALNLAMNSFSRVLLMESWCTQELSSIVLL